MSTASAFTQLPEAMEVVDVGPYLKSLREHYRLSVNDVAHRLHIRPKYIESMELSDFDSMPSKVYARGYVASYAEFLGINPNQVVEKCFGPKPVKKDEFFVPTPALRAPRPPMKLWLIAAAVLFVAIAGYDYMQQSEDAPGEAAYTEVEIVDENGEALSSVSEVPEDMLAHTRQLLMPTADAYRCLVGTRALGCLRVLGITKGAEPLRSMVDARFARGFGFNS